jgi:D-alanyl-D-alanine carboxypeptidase
VGAVMAVVALIGGGGEAPKGIAAAAGQRGECVDCYAALEDVAATATATPSPTATPTPAAAYGSVPVEVTARAVAVLEAPCGTLLYGQDEHRPLPPASLTKIVTALTAIGRVELSDEVEVRVSASELLQRSRSSVMGLEPDMKVSVQDLFYGMFLPSGNDAAIALAELGSGDVATFVGLMNQEAKRLGMNNSRFSNPHGLGSQGMRSTAYDMALAGMALMENPTLAEISGAATYTTSNGLELWNSNRLLGIYAGAYGVKIGYTRSAGHTIVAAATRDGRDIFVSVLDSDSLYSEVAALLDWAFASTEPQCTASAARN